MNNEFTGNKNNNKNKNYDLYFLIFRLVFITVIIISLTFTKYVSPSVFNNIKTFYNNSFNLDINPNEIINGEK